MTTSFFQHATYQGFLEERYELLKKVRPRFSSRAFAKKAGIKSHVYFRLVVNGERNLSVEYAEKFARGLGLDPFEKECLVTRVALENAEDQKTRLSLMGKYERLKRQAAKAVDMRPDHLKILADLSNLKLYLLAQSKQFRLNNKWLRKAMGKDAVAADIERRARTLFDAGLWVKDGDNVRTLAPLIQSGDKLAEIELLKTHQAFVTALEDRLMQDGADERVVGARTFLFDRRRLPEVQKRLEEFRRQMESEFECLDATEVFSLHVGFFRL